MLEELDLKQLDRVFTKHQGEEGALIPVLQEAQDIYGYLPKEVLVRISKRLKVPLSHIFGIVTFYAQFYLNPPGRHTIKSCQGTACHVRGAAGVLESLMRKLQVEPGGTTEDFNFSLETVACVGTCFLAPVIMIDKDYYGKLTPKRAADILKKYFQKPERENP
jgi:NADH-quinone oxidoreductase subunit E